MRAKVYKLNKAVVVVVVVVSCSAVYSVYNIHAQSSLPLSGLYTRARALSPASLPRAANGFTVDFLALFSGAPTTVFIKNRSSRVVPFIYVLLSILQPSPHCSQLETSLKHDDSAQHC